MIQSIAVYCGSRYGWNEQFTADAKQLGKLLAQHQITLIYGGATVGLMGAVADATLEQGGQVIGVMPEVLVSKEISHLGLTEIHTVPDMHSRKLKMMQLADAFIALPGGPGTMEELFEVFTWMKIGIHRKPIAILNSSGYYDDLIQFLQTMSDQDFLLPEELTYLLIEDSPEAVIEGVLKR